MAEQLLILPSLVLGLAIGAYEAILIHRDVAVPTHRLAHTAHAIIIALIAVFITMNTTWFLTTTGLAGKGWYTLPIVVQAAVGIIMAIKIHAASNAIQSSVGGTSVGLGETWAHSIIVGGLTVAAPYAWPLLAPVLPVWLGGSGGVTPRR